MIKKRKQYSPEFKAKVALAALRNEESTAELAGTADYTLCARVFHGFQDVIGSGEVNFESADVVKKKTTLS